jgi:uncharacterized protein (TIGR02246 family)
VDDETQIRELAATWMAASQAGDVGTVLGLISDDAVFLVPGRPPMRKAEFEAAARAQAGPGGARPEGSSEIQEIKVLGDWAFMWTKLSVMVAPEGAPPTERAGYTLTILRKEAGRWAIARDANLLAPVQQARS